MKKLSVVIPSYNEMGNFKAGCLNQVKKYLKQNKLDWQIIIVDDGSTDGSNKLIQNYAQKQGWLFIQNPHQGKAAAIRTGVFKAQAKFTLFTDFDQATPLSEAEKLLPFLDKGYKIVIGSREVKGSLRQKEPWYRHLMGKGFNFGVQLIAIRGIHDTQCGFKIFETQIARSLFKALKVYQPKKEKHAFTGAFDVELLYLANKKNIKIAEVPVHWQHTKTTRVSPIRDSLRMGFDVLKIRLADILGRYS